MPGSSTEIDPGVWPGVSMMRSPNTSSPSPTAVTSTGAAMLGMSSAPAYGTADGAASSTPANEPMWSECEWVSTT